MSLRRMFALKLGTWCGVVAAMAIVLADALLMTSATHDLGFFLDEDGKELKLITDALECIEVASCEDFRLTFFLPTTR